MINDINDWANTGDSGTGRGVENINIVFTRNIRLRIPSSGGDPASIRRYRGGGTRKVRNRRPSGSDQTRTVLSSDPVAAIPQGSINADAPNLPHMHSGLDAQDRLLRRAGLDRVLKRRTRLPVNCPLITATVGEALL